MKTLFTFLLFSLTGLNLFASVSQKDTTKLTATTNAFNTPKQQPLFVKYSDSLSLLTLKHSSDSIKSVDSLIQFNHLKMLADMRRTDSANYRILVSQIDTIRSKEYAANLDSMKVKFKLMSTDTVKLQLKLAQNKLYKGPIYTEIASRYLNYDTLSNKRLRSTYQTQAVSYTMQALHLYSLYNDTLGMRISFDALSKVYVAQKKYSEAKWFTLQSNTLSRIKKDVPNTISSLITLANIKGDIADYDLAAKDLTEAIQIAQANHLRTTESEVLRYYAMLYSKQKDYKSEAAILKKRDLLEASIHKSQNAALFTKTIPVNTIKHKKADSTQQKKKLYTSNVKKAAKPDTTKRIAEL
jgi:hypothetical protein